MSINEVTLVSGGFLSLAEQKAAMSDKISANDIVDSSTCDRIINVLQLDCALKVGFQVFWIILNGSPINMVSTIFQSVFKIRLEKNERLECYVISKTIYF